MVSKKIIPLILFGLFSNFLFVVKVEAASLSLQPSSSQISVGNTVSLRVVVDTNSQFINSAESIIEYPKDLLEVVSIDKNSIFSLWIQEPVFSNTLGQISFSGGSPNPGFQGSAGRLMTVTLKAKKAGVASLTFLDPAVRANDGLGTDILRSQLGATITISDSVINEQPQRFLMGIYSSTHPNQNNWYNANTVKLAWRVPEGTQAIKTLLGSYPKSDPTVYYSDVITQKTIENINDGVWYFHANYQKGGTWSPSEHFQIKIDTESPTEVTASAEKNESGNFVIEMKAKDSLSGVDHFLITSDFENSINVQADGKGQASSEVVFSTAGEHVVTVTAYDKAGNTAKVDVVITTTTVSDLTIDSYPSVVKINENIEAMGTAPYPHALIKITLQDSDGIIENYKIKSDSASKFIFTSKPVTKKGSYTLLAEIVNNEGVVKYSSEKVSILVKSPLILQIGSYTIGLMKVLIPALILLIIFFVLLWYMWFRFFMFYQRVKKETYEAERMAEKSFALLRKDVHDRIVKMKKRQSKGKFTAEEISFLERLEDDLSQAEKIVDKEIKDVLKK